MADFTVLFINLGEQTWSLTHDWKRQSDEQVTWKEQFWPRSSKVLDKPIFS